MVLETGDLVFINGKVITVDSNDSIAEAVAIKRNRILCVGSTSEVERLIDAETNVIDLKGKTLLPGFIDAHVHLASTAVALEYMVRIHSPPIKSVYEILKKIKEKASQTPKGQWIIGRGSFMQPQKLIEKRYPTRSELDEVAPDHPVVIMAGSHLSMLNSTALEAAKISRETMQPPFGHIYKEPVSGEPTGMLSELINTLPIPKLTYEQTKKAIKTVAQNLFIQHGVTTIHEISDSSQNVRIYQELVSKKDLHLRLRLYPVIPRQVELRCIISLGLCSGFGNEQLQIGGVKVFVDGGTSGGGAAMYEAYNNDPKNYGSLTINQDKLTEIVSESHKAGLQVILHACGDRAQDMALDAVEAASRLEPKEDHRHRIEHAGNYFVTPERMERMKKVGVVPVPNSQMLNSFGDFLEELFGERAKKIFPFKSLLDKGIRFPIASDSTGTQPEAANPVWGIWCAVARKTYNGRIICPEEEITVMDAIRKYTIDAAYAGFEEGIKGSIEQGKLADMIVLSDDILTVPIDDIKNIKVEMTIIDGKIVYKS